jgi:hypothetical protein
MCGLGAIALLALLVGAQKSAVANGAFPDSLQVLLPASHPQRIVLATNFGLIISEDDGATWEWACEPRRDDNTILYQQTAAPSDRMFAVLINHGLVYSDDAACTWTSSGGALTTAVAHDAFADPSNPARVFAVGSEPSDTFTPSSVFRSDDGGVSFGAALDTAPVGGDMLGVESAFSNPATVYLAMYGTMGVVPGMLEPILGRSDDGGAHWSSRTLSSALGPASFRIIAVDPADSQHLFLRVTEAFAEKLAVSSDGGSTFTEPLSVSQQFTAFARLASGTILLGGSDDDNPVAFRSTDGGASFQSWPSPPHLRGLAERDGKLYAAADNYRDGFAIGVSTDEGATFRPLMTFDQVKRVKPCVLDACRDVCDNLAGLTVWSQAVCGNSPDAGAPDAGHPPPPPASGCACDAALSPPWSQATPMLALALALAWLLASRRRTGSPRPRRPRQFPGGRGTSDHHRRPEPPQGFHPSAEIKDDAAGSP